MASGGRGQVRVEKFERGLCPWVEQQRLKGKKTTMIDVARLLYNSQGNRLIYSVLIRLHKLCTSENFIFGQFGYLLLR